MNMLANLKYDDSIEHEKDTISTYQVFDSNIYDVTIKYAYLQKSRAGALGLHLAFDIDGKEYREALYVTNRNGDNFYKDQNGNKHYLPSFNHADALAAFTCKKPLSELDTESKIIKLYNYDAGKEIPTEVPMITAMLDKPVKLGVIKQKEFKQINDGSGNYVDSDEIREVNKLDKVFRSSDSMTTAEVRAEADKAEFADQWLSKWQGQVRDKTANKQPQTSTSSSNQIGKTTASLFD